MSTLKWLGVGVAVLAAGGVVSRTLGSTPEAPMGGPLAPCGPHPNCARVRVSITADPVQVANAVREALVQIGAAGIAATAAGWTASAPVGPFTDDVEVAVEADGPGSILWIRSASRVGRSDLGVNARRAERIARLTKQTLVRPN